MVNGKQKLKVAFIYNKTKLELVREEPLKAQKGEEVTQFGQAIYLRKRAPGASIFKVINVHLSGGKTEKDDATRVQ